MIPGTHLHLKAAAVIEVRVTKKITRSRNDIEMIIATITVMRIAATTEMTIVTTIATTTEIIEDNRNDNRNDNVAIAKKIMETAITEIVTASQIMNLMRS